jgi:WD40 repeat protein
MLVRFLSPALGILIGCVAPALAREPDSFQTARVLKGHTDPVYAVAVSPDGRFVATGSFDKSIKLWDAKTGREVRTLGGKNGHQNQILSLAFSPDGATLASGGSDNVVKLWDVPASRAATVYAHPAGAAQVALAADGKTLAVGGTDGTIKLWTSPDGKADYKPGRTLAGHKGAITGLAFAPNGQTLVSIGADDTLRYWNPTKGDLLALVNSPTDFTALAVGANGTVYTTTDGQLVFWPAEPKQIPKLRHIAVGGTLIAAHALRTAKRVGDAATVGKALAVTPNGSQVLTAGTGKTITLWNAGNGNAERTLAAAAPVTAIAVSKNGQQVAAAHGAKPMVTLFNFNDGAAISHFNPPAQVTDLAFHPNNPILAGALADHRALAWSVAFDAGQPPPPEFGQPTQSFPHPTAVRAITFTRDGNTLLTAAGDKEARAWKYATDQPTKSLSHPNLVDAVQFDKTGKLLATGCHDGKLRVWDAATGKATKTIDAHTKPQANPIYTVVWSPDAKHLATGSFDRSIKIWDADSGKLVKEIPGQSDLPVAETKAMKDTKGKKDKKDTKDKKGEKDKEPANPKTGHFDQVFTLAYTKDGKYLASGSSDRTVKLWDAKTGKLVRDFPNPALPDPAPGQARASHPGFVHAVRFTPDGQRLVSAGTAPRGQAYLAVWSVGTGKRLAGQELAVGPVYALELLPGGEAAVLGCGPKARFQPECDALIVALPAK